VYCLGEKLGLFERDRKRLLASNSLMRCSDIRLGSFPSKLGLGEWVEKASKGNSSPFMVLE
jgi:hypothetical protein